MATSFSRQNLFIPSDVHPLDIVSEKFQPLSELPPDRLAETVFVLTTKFDLIAYQTKNREVFIHRKGHEDIHCEELSGAVIVQAAFCGFTVYILTANGILYSRDLGDHLQSNLGRPCDLVPANRFGHVSVNDAVLAVAARETHALVMTELAVFAFGDNTMGAIGNDKNEKHYGLPTKIYEASDDKAPCQVATGLHTSIVLLHNGNVLTCGKLEYGTGHGSHDVNTLTPVPGLTGKRVQQIGSTEKTAYALADGILYVMGYNFDGRAGLGHNKRMIREPTAITIDGNRKITSFRCSLYMVLAQLDTGKMLYWGCQDNEIVIKQPQAVDGFHRPRDVFGKGCYHCTGGIVYIDKGWPLTTKDGESEINKYQKNGHQQKGQNLRLPSDSRSTQQANTSQNVDERKLKIEPADIESSFKHDRELLTVRTEQIEYTRFVEKVDELHQLEIQCTTLKSEKEQMANLYSSQATEHKKLKQEYDALHTEYDRLKSEKQQETNSRMLQLTEYQKLVKQYDDLFLKHNQLQEKYSVQLSEKEQLHAKCLKLETDIRELDLKYSAAKSPSGSACLEFAAVNMVAREITSDWKMLARFLGLEYCVIEEIDRYGYAKYKEKAHQALRKWQRKSGENATKQVLIDALEDVRRKDIADDLRDM